MTHNVFYEGGPLNGGELEKCKGGLTLWRFQLLGLILNWLLQLSFKKLFTIGMYHHITFLKNVCIS